jgi:hypothetical protein
MASYPFGCYVRAKLVHTGRHNPEIAVALFPHKSAEDQAKFSQEKEAYFRSLAQNGVPLAQRLLKFTLLK